MLSLFIAPFFLGIAALLNVALALSVRRRRTRGSDAFFWLMLAAGEWSAFSMLHWLAGSFSAKFTLAQVEYLGIASTAPLWLMFAMEYTRSSWVRHRRALVALWTIPILTMAAALTSRYHSALWTEVIVTGPGPAVYRHGWWFWVSFAYGYALLAAGTVAFVTGLRQLPHYRRQFVALLTASIIPWLANALYIAGINVLGGLDLTPIAFAASGLLIAWALHRSGLFDLVPIARDQLVDSLSDPVLVVDSARRVLDINTAGKQIAVPLQPWLGRSVDELFPFLSRSTVTTQSTAVETVAHGAVSYELRVARVQAKGDDAKAWLVFLHDVTEQRRTAAEREALVRQKTEFVATVSHELRTPMFAIRGSLQLVLGSAATSLANEDRKLLAIALSTTERLVRIVNDLLDLSAIEAQQLPLRRGIVSVDALIADALSDVSQFARQASVHLQSGVPLGPPSVMGDRDRLIQALVNLLSNAIKVSPSGGVVTCRAYQDRDLVCIAVDDRGPGISHDVMHRLFGRYQQLDEALSRRSGGTGLGLAITKALVEQHGGHIQVQSTPGHGSTFIVSIPLATEGHAEPSAPRPATAPPRFPATAQAGSRHRESTHVLVADDEPDVREVLVEALRRHGYTVSTAGDGEEAVAALRSGDIDVAVLDLHMPRLSGYDVIRVARTEGPRMDLPIVVLTGAVDQLDSLELLGASVLLAKPTDIKKLIAEVEALAPVRTNASRED